MFNCALAFPTVRQVMDFEVGDIFHYQYYTGSPSIPSTYYIESQELIGKQYNLDSTTVTYQFKRISYQRASQNANWCNKITDTLTQIYTNLDSSCTGLYANYCTQNSLSLDVSTLTFSEQTNSIYQGRTLVNGKKDNNNYVTCVAGLGFVAHSEVGSIHSLVWYKKGNEIYGTSIDYLQNPTDPYTTLLTRAQVYNFEVGDVIQMRVDDEATYYNGYQMSYDAIYRVSYNILSKTQITPDSVLYIALKKRQWISGDTLGFYFSQDTIGLRYGRLNDYVNDPCKVSVSYTCDSLLVNRVTNNGGYGSSSVTYIEGLGNFNSRTNSSLYYAYYGETLTYWFKAAENKSCGTFFVFDSLNVDSLLRKREVFDFVEGDIFQFEWQYNNTTASTYMVQHKILAKTETNTEWTYKIQRKQQLIAGDSLGFYIKIDTIEQAYDNLDNWVAPASNLFVTVYSKCEPLLANEFRSFPQAPYIRAIKDLYIKGMGVYRDTVGRLHERLTYYHKVSGNTTCGDYFNFALPVPPTGFISYYEPNDKVIKVQLLENEATSVIEIINFQGQRIYQTEVAPKQTEVRIAAQMLESQIYIVRLLNGKNQSYQKIAVFK